MRKWKILKSFLLIVSPLILIILLGSLVALHDILFSHWPIPDYQRKMRAINLSVVCDKIRGNSLRKACSLKLKNPQSKISMNIRSSNYLCGDLAGLCEAGLNPAPEYIACCRALVENPYFCERIGFVGPVFFNEVSKGECYEDAALIWKDPSLCEKAKNRDHCYLRLVIKELENS